MTGSADTPSTRGRAHDEARAAFVARLTAGATHEVRNILAIVKESAGLVEDLVRAAGGDGAADPDKVLWALGRIQLQVTRGTELSTSLNRVMHGLDRAEEAVALNEAVAHSGLLSRRHARQVGRRIELEAGPDALAVTTNALDLYRALVAVMEWAVGRVPEGGALVVRPESREGCPAIALRADPPAALAEPAPAGDEGPREAMSAVGAELEPDGDRLLLLFPGAEAGRR